MTYVIGEIGINWNGDMSLARKMIRRSKEAGADAVKFQSFDLSHLVNRGFSQEIIDSLLRSAVTSENITTLRDYARSAEIDFGVTAFSEDAVEVIRDYVDFIKIRCKDGDKLYGGMSDLAYSAIATDIPTIISVSLNPPFKQSGVRWMNCVSRYPCGIDDVKMERVKACGGYSNHCDDEAIFDLIREQWIKTLEVHVTDDKNNESYLDNPVSYDFDALSRIVRRFR